ncbi:MAG: glycosyltransferase family 2 protein [Gammaproteobacteria bacterium]|nr:glycosyltransferase family 2 protein [Gammaproteobacteria bacterium]
MSVQILDTAESIDRSVADSTELPLVSVVIPTRNRSALLQRAINSVLQQTYSNLEILVVDDASTDDTPAMVQSFNDARIRYLRHEKNKGGSATRNTGIRAAAGKHIAFLDDDDEWEPTKAAEQAQALVQYDAVLCKYRMNVGISRESEQHDWKPVVDVDELKQGFLRGGGTSALMVRAEVVKQTLFDETLPRCQDWDLCIRIAQKYTIGYLQKPLVRFNNGDHERISNKIGRLTAEQLEQELRMLHKHKEFFGDRWYRKHMCRFMLYGIRHRTDKVRHLRYLVRRCGVRSVLEAMTGRLLGSMQSST